MEPFLIEWQAPEFEYREKSIRWYWGTIVVAACILGVAVWQRNFLFAVFTTIAEVLVLVWSGREPRIVPFRLTEKGLTIHERTFYPTSDVEHFSVEGNEYESWPILALHFHRRLRLPLHIKIPSTRLPEIQHRLRLMLPEMPWEESFADTLERFFRF